MARVLAIWTVLLLGGALVLSACARRPADAAAQAPVAGGATVALDDLPHGDYWYGAFLQGQRIGYLHFEMRPTERDGEALIEVRGTDHVTLELLGQKMEQIVQMVTFCRPDWRPVSASITISSGGRDTAITATYFDDRIECQRTSAEGTQDSTVPIPEGVRLVADVRAALTDGNLDVGEVVELYEFNPITLALDKSTVTALRNEELELGGERYQALVTQTQSSMATVLTWLDPEHRMLQMEMDIMAAKLQFRLEDEETVLAELGAPARVDLVTATALRPDQPIERPRTTRRLVLRVHGLDKLATVPNDEFIATEQQDEGWYRVTITSPEPSEAAGAPVPFDEPELQEYLKPSTYIESDHEKMIAAANEILGEDPPSGSLARARLVHAWVHRRIAWQANIGLLRSALEILNDPAGVCRDAAALYTALARAAGVPTRVCAGLLYMTDSFAGHAWAESWDGERWVPFDPTVPTTFVDATHLKLAQGAAYTCMFDMMPALGGMKIEVLEQSH